VIRKKENESAEPLTREKEVARPGAEEDRSDRSVRACVFLDFWTGYVNGIELCPIPDGGSSVMTQRRSGMCIGSHRARQATEKDTICAEGAVNVDTVMVATSEKDRWRPLGGLCGQVEIWFRYNGASDVRDLRSHTDMASQQRDMAAEAEMAAIPGTEIVSARRARKKEVQERWPEGSGRCDKVPR
jgi:hypothetical protein